MATSTFTPHFCCIRRTQRWTATRLGLARLLAAVDKRDVSAEQIRPSFLLARNVLRHVVAPEATGEATAASFRDAENAGDVANTSRPARFPRAPRGGPRDDPRRDDTPTSAAKVPTPHPRARSPWIPDRVPPPTTPPRARHLASANATSPPISPPRAPTSRSSASPPPADARAALPPRGEPDRIAAVDDERRALRAALDASARVRRPSSTTRHQRRTRGETGNARNAREPTPPSSALRSPLSDLAAAAGGRRVPPSARGEVLAERLKGVGDVRGDGDV